MAEPQAKRIKQEDPIDTKPAQFRTPSWKLCGHLPEEQRLAIKEHAVLEAQKYLTQLSHVVRQGLEEGALPKDDVFEKWLDTIEAYKRNHNEFEVLVGVAGMTGAGKTTILNALLGVKELLPSSDDRAATAVPCKIAWNFDDQDGHEFKAVVYKMTREELTDYLTLIIKAFIARKDLLKEYDEHETEYSDERERQENLEEAAFEIAKGMEQIRVLFGLEEDDVEAIATADHDAAEMDSEDQLTRKANRIFEANHAVGELIDMGTQEVYASEVWSFARQIRPFLDTSKAQHGRNSDHEFEAWPLVKEVHIFVKSDILKSGICLVDLPGTGEIGESRAQVARRFNEKLEVTLIVASAHRATEEKEAQSLLSGHQAAQMRLDGSFNKRKFGLVLSKIDQLDIKTYIGRCQDKQGDVHLHELQNHLKESKARIVSLRKDTTRLAKYPRKLQARQKKLDAKLTQLKSTVQQEKNPQHHEGSASKFQSKGKKKATSARKELTQTTEAESMTLDLLRQVTGKLKELARQQQKATFDEQVASQGLAHWAVSKRNANVGDRITADMHRRLRKYGPVPEQLAGSLEDGPAILPTSAKAFWYFQNNSLDQQVSNEPIHGFPNEVYTGIPSLKQWIHRATLSSREAHLNLVLGLFNNAFQAMHAWSCEGDRIDMIITSREAENILSETHDKHRKRLRVALQELHEDVKSLDPFDDDVAPRAKFCGKAQSVARQWALKYPDEEGRPEKIFHSTQRAILVRGGNWTSGNGQRYEWISKLSFPLTSEITTQWLFAEKNKLPAVLNSFELTAMSLWNDYTNDIRHVIDGLGQGLGSQFNDIMETLKADYGNVLLELGGILKDLFQSLRKTDSIVLRTIQGVLGKMFETASEMTGPGCTKRRQEHLEKFIGKSKAWIFQKAWTQVRCQFEQRQEKIVQAFDKVTVNAIRDMKIKISLFLNRTLAQNNSMSDSQSKVRETIMLWKAAWEQDNTDVDHVLQHDNAIPTKLHSAHVQKPSVGQEEHASEDSQDSETDSDEQMDNGIVGEHTVDELVDLITKLPKV